MLVVPDKEVGPGMTLCSLGITIDFVKQELSLQITSATTTQTGRCSTCHTMDQARMGAGGSCHNTTLFQSL